MFRGKRRGPVVIGKGVIIGGENKENSRFYVKIYRGKNYVPSMRSQALSINIGLCIDRYRMRNSTG